LRFDVANSELDWFVARLLGDFEHLAAIPTLAHLLQHPDPEVQFQAASALAHLGVIAIPTLQVQLRDPETCLLAVRALNQINDDQVMPLLLSVVKNEQVAVREMALAALSRFAYAEQLTELLPVYLSALEDVEPSVRCTVINTLGRIAAASKGHHAYVYPDWIRLFAPKLWDVNLAVAEQAAIALGQVGTDAATFPLKKRLQSDAAQPLVLKMIHALAWIATTEAIATLAQVWQAYPESAIRQEIAAVLGRVPQPMHSCAAQLLLELLQQSPNLSPPVKQAVIHSLGSLEQPQSLDSLILLLADPHPGVQLHVIAALKQLNPALSYQSLQDKSQDPNLSPALHQGLVLALREW
jgi:HEAT repeat protein